MEGASCGAPCAPYLTLPVFTVCLGAPNCKGEHAAEDPRSNKSDRWPKRPTMPDGTDRAATVWILSNDASSSEPFISATIFGSKADGTLRVKTAHGERYVTLDTDAWTTSAPREFEPADLCALPELHTPELLHSLRRRFEEDGLYATWMGAQTLLWLHPSSPTPELFTAEQLMRAAAATDGVDTSADPGAYTLAERALRAGDDGRMTDLMQKTLRTRLRPPYVYCC